MWISDRAHAHARSQVRPQVRRYAHVYTTNLRQRSGHPAHSDQVASLVSFRLTAGVDARSSYCLIK